MKLLQQIAVIVSTVAALVPNARSQTFVRIPVHYPIASSFPVDINSDGQWELAILTSESPQRVGVFDAQQRRWVDGPRIVPVGSNSWTPFIHPDNGAMAYAYQDGDSVRIYNSLTNEDRGSWKIPYAHFAPVYFWGRAQSGAPFAAIFVWGSGNATGFRYFHDVVTGAMEFSQEGYPGHSIVAGYPDSGSLLLAVETGYFYGFHEIGFSHVDAMRGFDLVTAEGVVAQSFTFYLYSDSWSSPVIPPPLGHVRVATDPQTHDGYHLVYSSGIYTDWYLTRLASQSGAWESVSSWSDQAWRGAAALDALNDGQLSWVIPVAPTGWQRRNLRTGAIIDTLPDLPYVDIQQGQVITRDHLATFFLSDSSLYILRADVNSGILDGPDDGATADAGASQLSLAAYPNPFNAAVTLSWPTGTDAHSLTIYNILGQEVRSYRLSESRGEMSWDGRDTQGRSVASGVYFARLETRRSARTVKLVLLR